MPENTHQELRELISEAANTIVTEVGEVKDASGVNSIFRSSKEYEQTVTAGNIQITTDTSYPNPDVLVVKYHAESSSVTIYDHTDNSYPKIPSDEYGGDSLTEFCSQVDSIVGDSKAAEINEVIEEYQSENYSKPSLQQVVDALKTGNREVVHAVFGKDMDDMVVELLRVSVTINTHYLDDDVALISYRDHARNLGAFVIGWDDTPQGAFIHQVPHGNVGLRSGRDVPGLDSVRNLMGFDEDYLLDDAVEFTPHTRVRVQGDLRVTPLKTEVTEGGLKAELLRLDSFRDCLNHHYGRQEAEALLSSVRLYKFRTEFASKLYLQYDSNANEYFYNHFSNVRETGEVKTAREIAAEMKELFGTYSPKESVDVVEFGWEDGILPIDNHLVRLSSSSIYPLSTSGTEPVIVAVPDETLVSVTHDEHSEVQFELSRGLYEFSLLPEGTVPSMRVSPRP